MCPAASFEMRRRVAASQDNQGSTVAACRSRAARRARGARSGTRPSPTGGTASPRPGAGAIHPAGNWFGPQRLPAGSPWPMALGRGEALQPRSAGKRSGDGPVAEACDVSRALRLLTCSFGDSLVPRSVIILWAEAQNNTELKEFWIRRCWRGQLCQPDSVGPSELAVSATLPCMAATHDQVIRGQCHKAPCHRFQTDLALPLAMTLACERCHCSVAPGRAWVPELQVRAPTWPRPL